MAQAPSSSSFTNPIPNLGSVLRRGEVIFALGLMSILLVLIFPMPKWLLDIALAFSITFSILILMTSLFIEKPLDFNSFPTILLVSTMLRLSLNVASTRLILSKGHEGPDAAGEVIRAFGGFLMGDSFIIGVIIFAILVIVNFVVITKGSGRIAEVSARFSLDSLPGKQMAIDADVSAGIINEKEAKDRRQVLEAESSFFGSMDGAAKFVRGDAIAGLLITGINIVAGIIIGISHDLTFADAAHTYTLLTIGDGLVTQIPALIVSTSAGLLVSKSGVEGSTDKALFQQLSAHPLALGMCSVVMIGLGFMPGIPKIPFFLIALVTGGGAWYFTLKGQEELEAQNFEKDMEPATLTPEKETEQIQSALQIDQIRLELGYALLTLVNQKDGKGLTEQIKTLRQQLAKEMGFVLPSVRIQDNLQLDSRDYVIQIKEVIAGRGMLRPSQYLVMNPTGEKVSLEGEETTDPAFGIPALWINEDQKIEAEDKGYTVVDAITVLLTHFGEVIKDHVPELLSYAETKKLLDELSKTQEKLVQDLVPSQISIGGIQRVLHNLLRERVSIRDLTTILEGISEVANSTHNSLQITEHVRTRLARQICHDYLDANGVLPVIHLSAQWHQIFQEAIVGDTEKHLALSPTDLQHFISKVRQAFDQAASLGENPVLLTSGLIRPHVRNITERFRPLTTVLSQNEIHPKIRIRTVGQVLDPSA